MGDLLARTVPGPWIRTGASVSQAGRRVGKPDGRADGLRFGRVGGRAGVFLTLTSGRLFAREGRPVPRDPFIRPPTLPRRGRSVQDGPSYSVFSVSLFLPSSLLLFLSCSNSLGHVRRSLQTHATFFLCPCSKTPFLPSRPLFWPDCFNKSEEVYFDKTCCSVVVVMLVSEKEALPKHRLWSCSVFRRCTNLQRSLRCLLNFSLSLCFSLQSGFDMFLIIVFGFRDSHAFLHSYHARIACDMWFYVVLDDVEL